MSKGELQSHHHHRAEADGRSEEVMLLGKKLDAEATIMRGTPDKLLLLMSHGGRIPSTAVEQLLQPVIIGCAASLDLGRRLSEEAATSGGGSSSSGRLSKRARMHYATDSPPAWAQQQVLENLQKLAFGR